MSAAKAASGIRINIRRIRSIVPKPTGHVRRQSHPHVPFLWLKLPEPWLSGTFKNAALAAGVLVDDEDEFKAARTEKAYFRVRVAYSSPQAREDVAAGFAILRRLLENGSASYDSYS